MRFGCNQRGCPEDFLKALNVCQYPVHTGCSKNISTRSISTQEFMCLWKVIVQIIRRLYLRSEMGLPRCILAFRAPQPCTETPAPSADHMESSPEASVTSAWCRSLLPDSWQRHRAVVLRRPFRVQCCQIQSTSERNRYLE